MKLIRSEPDWLNVQISNWNVTKLPVVMDEGPRGHMLSYAIQLQA